MMHNSVDMHNIPFEKAPKEIPFSLEHGDNMVRPLSSSSVINNIRGGGGGLAQSASTLMPTSLRLREDENNPNTDSILSKYEFPPAIAQEIKAVMSLVVIWSQKQGKKKFDQYLRVKEHARVRQRERDSVSVFSSKSQPRASSPRSTQTAPSLSTSSSTTTTSSSSTTTTTTTSSTPLLDSLAAAAAAPKHGHRVKSRFARFAEQHHERLAGS
jgi:hypothetical protein